MNPSEVMNELPAKSASNTVFESIEDEKIYVPPMTDLEPPEGGQGWFVVLGVGRAGQP